MKKLTLDLLLSRLNKPGGSRRQPGRRGGSLCLAVLLLAVTGGSNELGAPGSARAFEIGAPVSGSREPQGPPADRYPVYEHFLQRFRPLRADAARRRYLAAEVVTAANQNRIDPDLLFALVAVESNFNSTAVSRKGARGLGQIMFATGRKVAPTIVRGPRDLFSVPRNLHVAALYLRQLLIASEGDLRAALTAYHTGPAVGHLREREENEYVDHICRRFAALKTKREYRELMAMAAGNPALARN